MIALQLILFCGIFTLMVKISTIGGVINAIFFYPKGVQERAVCLGLTTREEIKRKNKRFKIPFILILAALLILIIGLWNGVNRFAEAYLQSLLFLEVMNWFDGIVIDRLWVGHSKLWVIKGTEDIPFVKPWKTVLKERLILSAIWVVLATVSAGIVVLVF